jgi:hypothetical protein
MPVRVKMQGCFAKLNYSDSNSMKVVKGGTLALVLHFQETDRLNLLSFLF